LREVVDVQDEPVKVRAGGADLFERELFFGGQSVGVAQHPADDAAGLGYCWPAAWWSLTQR
jgi:hypothetical protein